ncbi:MAG TPA: hypothetical protein VLA04_01535 [Verrucomicrobiae bacterium]|nr:hypothetical protein [Verrucomicrobiae bacterium]
MAFEDKTTTTTASRVTKPTFFDSGAFFGIVIGILILAGVLFLFRNQIAAKIAQWRNTSPVAVVQQPSIPPVIVSPSPVTPTPTATAVSTPRPIVTATPKTTPAPRVATTTSNLPQSGPEDSLLLLIGGGTLGLSATAVRYQVYRRKLRNKAHSIDIA